MLKKIAFFFLNLIDDRVEYLKKMIKIESGGKECK